MFEHFYRNGDNRLIWQVGRFGDLEEIKSDFAFCSWSGEVLRPTMCLSLPFPQSVPGC